VDAALGACGVLVGSPEERPGTSASDSVAGSDGTGQAAAAALRAAQGAAGAAMGGIPEPATLAAGRRLGGQGGTSGTSLTSAHILFGSNNKSMQQSGLDTARRLSLLPPASIPAGPPSASPATNAGSGLSSGAAASVAADVESTFNWPPGVRRKYESALGVFEMPELSAMTAEKLVSAAHQGSLGKAMASKLPDMKADFIDEFQNNMLLGVMLTCGVVSPARFAEQLFSSRSKKPHSHLLLILANWMLKIRSEAVAAGAVAAQNAGRLGKLRRSGGGPSGPGSAGGDRDGSTDNNAEGDGDEEGTFDVDEIPDVA